MTDKVLHFIATSGLADPLQGSDRRFTVIKQKARKPKPRRRAAMVSPLLAGLLAQTEVPAHRCRLTRTQAEGLKGVHSSNAEELCDSPNSDVMWRWAAGLLTWSYVAARLEVGEAEIDPQLALATRVLERFRETGVVTLDAQEKLLMLHGAHICDALVRETPEALAIEAAHWSEAQILVITASAQAGAGIDLKRPNTTTEKVAA